MRSVLPEVGCRNMKAKEITDPIFQEIIRLNNHYALKKAVYQALYQLNDLIGNGNLSSIMDY